MMDGFKLVQPGFFPAGDSQVPDELVASIYGAASGLAPWTEPLARIEALLDAWLVQVHGISKTHGGVLFSYEAGKASPECAIDWFHDYHKIDPRAGLAASSETGRWIACHEHFDDAYVAGSPFYQEFLIPYGGRYVCGGKIFEDDEQALVISLHRAVGKHHFDEREQLIAKRISAFIAHAFYLAQRNAQKASHAAAGFLVLQKMWQPIFLLDASRKIVFSNSAANEVLGRGDVLESAGDRLVCRIPDSDIDLLLALRNLGLVPNNHAHAAILTPLDRQSLRLKRRAGKPGPIVANLVALRPESVMGSFGGQALAMMCLFDPGASQKADPFTLRNTFGLTPAEARFAALIAEGRTVKEAASSLGVAESTARSHLKSIFNKTGTSRQADLDRRIW